LLDSSDTWIINDEDKAPGFILANLDFDVWLGNSRGNKHSRKHIKYNPDKDK
jgi:lysosomal acid lipase/cholesteryl ester hydrolase